MSVLVLYRYRRFVWVSAFSVLACCGAPNTIQTKSKSTPSQQPVGPRSGAPTRFSAKNIEERAVQQMTAELHRLADREQFEAFQERIPDTVAALKRACHAGNGAACHAVAEMADPASEKRFGISVDVSGIDACVYERLGCDRNNVAACDELLGAVRWERCVGVEKEQSQLEKNRLKKAIFARLDDLCRAGDFEACEALYENYGFASRFGDETGNSERASVYLTLLGKYAADACAAKNAKACETAAERGASNNVGSNGTDTVAAFYARARALREQGCSEKVNEDCQWLAELWDRGPAMRRGKADRDLLKAAVYAYRSCELGDVRGCLAAGKAWAHDVDAPVKNGVVQPVENGYVEMMGIMDPDTITVMVPPSIESFQKAKGALHRACDEGVSAACREAAHLYDRTQTAWKNRELATQYYKRTRDLLAPRCEAGFGGCYTLSFLIGEGEGGPVDYQKLHRYVELDCEQGNSFVCARAAQYCTDGMIGPPDFEKAREYLRHACNETTDHGCVPLGYLYETGLGGEKNIDTAAALYRRRCNDSSKDGCVRLQRLTDRTKAK